MGDRSPGGTGRVRAARLTLYGVVVLALAGAGLAPALRAPRPAADTGSTSSTAPVPALDQTSSPTAGAPETTTTTMSAPPCDRRSELDSGSEPPPRDWLDRVRAAVDSPAWGPVQRSVSIWVEGHGEVVAVDGDAALLPASNEKLLTAIGARILLEPDHRFRTEVRLLDHDLVLEAGGDPTLGSHGTHSLEALARQVRAAGVTRIASVHVDASHFEPALSAAGWQDWQIPAYAGPLSALTVDDNRWRADAAFLADPAKGNAEAFVEELRAAGVTVDGPVAHGSGKGPGTVVGAVESATVAELTAQMLLHSDNEIAEALVREIGGGVTATGLARITDALEPWCLELAGVASDGSGLSREDWRSAREWRRMLQVAVEQPWAAELWAGLPVAGRTGTLAGRLAGPATAGVVRAKTGSIIGGTALSGYAVTPEGRDVVFSILVNGDPATVSASVAAVDHLVAAVVAG